MERHYDGVCYIGGSCEPLIVRFNRQSPWFKLRCTVSKKAQRGAFKELGEHLNAERADLYGEIVKMEVKPMWCDDHTWSEDRIFVFDISGGAYRFFELDPNGELQLIKWEDLYGMAEKSESRR